MRFIPLDKRVGGR